MFTSAKEIHIYTDSTIQQLNSNRKLSIAPELIDMYFNSTIIEYLNSKLPPLDKGMEEYKSRNTLFYNLKKSFKGLPYYSEDEKSAYYILPNAFAILGCNIKYSYNKKEDNKVVAKKYSASIKFNDDIYTDGSGILILIISDASTTRTVTINLTSVLSEVKSKDGLFYFYNSFVDILNNDYGLNVKNKGNGSFILDLPIGDKLLSISYNSPKCTIVTNTELVKTCKVPSALISSGTIYPYHEVGNELRNPIRMSNSHRNPVCSVTDVFEVQCPTFDVCSSEILYYKYPRLLDIKTGNIPEIPITEELINTVAKNILLDTNNSYEKQINELKLKQ